VSKTSGKSEITDFEGTVRIDENIAGFKISMDDLSRMEILHSLENLIHYVPIMQILQNFLTNSVVEISLHKFEYQIEIFVILGTDDIMQLDDVGVRQFMQIHDLAIGPLSVDRMLERIKYFFKSQGLVRLSVCHLPNVAVCSGAHFFCEGVTSQHVMFDFFRHFLWLVDLNIISMECK